MAKEKPPAALDPRGELPTDERRFQPTLASDEVWAIRDLYEKARRAGHTFAGTPSGWIAEWLVEAARVKATGRALLVTDARCREAAALLMEKRPFSSEAERVYEAVIACGRLASEGMDPFALSGSEPLRVRSRTGR